jgi:sec-independent protein translocase protein TatA
MLGNLTGWHLIIILAVILLIFGAAKLPALARSAGQSIKIFKGEMKTAADDNTDAAAGIPTSGTATSGTATSVTDTSAPETVRVPVVSDTHSKL